MFSKTIQAVRKREALAEDVDWDLYISIVTYRKWQEFFTKEELEEMRQPGYFDEIETILKKAQKG